MATQKYNKSEIMKDAWRLFRLYRKFSWSFGKCLSIAWDNAKIVANAVMEHNKQIKMIER